MKNINISLQNCLLYLSLVDKKYKAFTLAEILLSLTVIGIVAAIALPSLLGNANERAWETQKKALYTRFSQSLPLLPSLNGYGTLIGTLSSNSDDGEQHVDTDNAAESFIRDGLSKVMKITNICDSEHLADCGLPDKIVPIDGVSTINLSSIKSIGKFNNKFSIKLTPISADGEQGEYEQLDTKASAFETVNGESVLVYYNPNCVSNFMLTSLSFTQEMMCANFVYDLNGKKGPNTVGKDIGFISALYATDPVVVAPNPYPNDLPDIFTKEEISQECKKYDNNARIPNIDELTSLFYNKKLINFGNKSGGDSCPNNCYWSSTSYSSGSVYGISANSGRKILTESTGERYVRCIKR